MRGRYSEKKSLIFLEVEKGRHKFARNKINEQFIEFSQFIYLFSKIWIFLLLLLFNSWEIMTLSSLNF